MRFVKGEISHRLPPLRVAGNRIIDTLTGKILELRGVKLSGATYRRYVASRIRANYLTRMSN
jgi:hypothetical protein